MWRARQLSRPGFSLCPLPLSNGLCWPRSTCFGLVPREQLSSTRSASSLSRAPYLARRSKWDNFPRGTLNQAWRPMIAKKRLERFFLDRLLDPSGGLSLPSKTVTSRPTSTLRSSTAALGTEEAPAGGAAAVGKRRGDAPARVRGGGGGVGESGRRARLDLDVQRGLQPARPHRASRAPGATGGARSLGGELEEPGLTEVPFDYRVRTPSLTNVPTPPAGSRLPEARGQPRRHRGEQAACHHLRAAGGGEANVCELSREPGGVRVSLPPIL